MVVAAERWRVRLAASDEEVTVAAADLVERWQKAGAAAGHGGERDERPGPSGREPPPAKCVAARRGAGNQLRRRGVA